MDGETIVIRLELHVADRSLTGRASDDTGAVSEFAGWMGMMSAVDGLLTRRAPAAPDHHPAGAPEAEGE